MAELYLACAVGPGDFRKVVALKRLLPQHALDPQLLQMFLDEARLMARMAHPNIPQVHDVDDGVGAPDRAPFFAMEYVHGTDLRGILNESDKPLPIAQLLAIGAAVAAGLHYAHEMSTESGEPLGIVHRDVSPSNVLVSFGGTVKITDFGVAKWIQQRSLTYAGQLKGKFAHMSPEQCQGQPLDRRSDVFALGTLLYEMATGRPAFAADSDFELMSRIVNEDIRAPERPGESLPADLSAIILLTLARSRERRPASAQEVQLDLERFARDHRVDTSPLAVAEFLETLFNARVSEWREAIKSGFTLAEHLQRDSGDQVGGPSAFAGLRPAAPGARTETDARGEGILHIGAQPAVPRISRRGHWRWIAMGIVAGLGVLSLSIVLQTARPPAGRELDAEIRGRGVGGARTALPGRPAPVETMMSAAGLTASRPQPATAASDSPPHRGPAASKASAAARLAIRSARLLPVAGVAALPASARSARPPPSEPSPGDGDAEGPDIRPPDAPSSSPPPLNRVKVWDPDSPVPP